MVIPGDKVKKIEALVDDLTEALVEDPSDKTVGTKDAEIKHGETKES